MQNHPPKPGSAEPNPLRTSEVSESSDSNSALCPDPSAPRSDTSSVPYTTRPSSQMNASGGPVVIKGSPQTHRPPTAEEIQPTVTPIPVQPEEFSSAFAQQPEAYSYEIQELEGQIIAGRYRVLKKLGEGGMGIVYLAEHVTIEKKVALKVLLHEYARKTDLKDRFLQEAKAAAKIGHENIVDITDFGLTPDGSVFFAMEFLEGRDLSQVIKQNGAMPWSRAKPILLQICRALGAAHSKGIIHRDMKPENIYLVEREGRADFVKVLDFGIAKMSMDEGDKRLTRTGMIFGTPEYMSPEQAQGSKPDHRVDIYAVGVIMYEMVTGSVPFKADTFMGILTKHIFEEPIPPSQMNQEVTIPVEVEEIILRSLAKDRDDRFQSMTEMAAAIGQASGRMTRPTGDTPSIAQPRIIPAKHTEVQSAGLNRNASQRARFESATLDEDSVLPRKKTGLIIAVAIGALIVIGGIVAAFSLKGKDDTQSKPSASQAPSSHQQPQQPPPVADRSAPNKQVEVTLKTTPPGASIFRGAYEPGKSAIGTTPTTILFDKGENKIALTLRLEGYVDKKFEVVPNKSQAVLLELHQQIKNKPKQASKHNKIITHRPLRRTIAPPKNQRPPKVVKPAPPAPTPPKSVDTPQKEKKPVKKDEHIEDLMNPFD